MIVYGNDSFYKILFVVKQQIYPFNVSKRQ